MNDDYILNSISDLDFEPGIELATRKDVLTCAAGNAIDEAQRELRDSWRRGFGAGILAGVVIVSILFRFLGK